MSLPTGAVLKTYLRIETTAEDGLLDLLVAQAKDAVEALLDLPILACEEAFIDEGVVDLYGYLPLTKLLVPVYPVDADTLVVTDKDAVVVLATDYRLDPLTGVIRADPGVLFANPPYTLTCDVGLSAHPQYAARIEPILSRAIIDLASDWYQHRSPAAKTVSAGGGASTTYVEDTIPPRVRLLLAPYQLVRGGV